MIKKMIGNVNFILFIKFAAVGVLNTVIDSLSFFLMCDIGGLNEFISNIVAYMISSLNSYLVNSKFVYKEDKYLFSKYFKFMLGNTSVILISTISLLILSKYFEYKIIAKIITVPITVFLNFFFQRFILFKNSADKLMKQNG